MKDDAERPLLASGSMESQYPTTIGGSSTADRADAPQTMFELLSSRADLHADRPAVEHDGRSLSYGGLLTRADRYATRLRERGVGTGDRVVLLLDRSMDYIVALFATWRLGATAVPVDPAVPRQRLAALLDDCSASLMVVSSREFRGEDLRTPILAFEAEPGPAGPVTHPRPAAGDEEPSAGAAYCLYTSGSTGRPKGVLISQRSISHYATMSAERIGLNSNDRVLQICSIGFDGSMQEISATIAAGACIVVYPQGRDVSTLSLDYFIERSNVSAILFPTALWRIWVAEHAWAGKYLPTCLRLVMTGGEKIERSDFKAWRSLDAAGAPVLVNVYGPTEATVSASMWFYAAGDPFDDDGEVPIGTANPGYSCHVVDDQLRPVPKGEIGELAIGGVGVAIGYLGRPAETASAFVPNPFSAPAGERMYLSGDRVRLNDSGQLEFIGRADAQVKVLGYRVEPGEIECVLDGHPDIVNAAVIARDSENGKQLAAFCQSRPGASPNEAELRDWLARSLPSYMVPARIEVLSELPMTVSGKLDRQALSRRSGPAEPATLRGEAAEPAEPAEPAEEAEDSLDARMSAIWKLTLGVENVAPNDNFFECGGHSLLVARLIWAVREATGVELGYPDVFADPTYGAIRSIVRERSGETGDAAEAPKRIEDGASERWLPVTFQQRRLLNQADDDFATAIRVVPVMLELSGALDVDRLQTAVDQTLGRHGVFRLRFRRTPSGFEQRLDGDGASFEFERRKIPSDTADPRAAALEIAGAWAYRGLDILNAEFVRTLILTGDSGKAWLVIALHHIAVDAQSVHVLLSEILGSYARGAPSGPRETLYLHYAMDQAERVESGKYAQDLRYWADYLRGSAPLLLPRATDAGRAEHPFPRRIVGIVEGERLDRLRACATAEKTTLFTLCLAALNILLADVAGQRDVLTGIPHHNRPGPEYRDCVGYFVNSIPMRMLVEDGRSVGDLLASVKSHMEEAPRHLGVTMADVDLPAGAGCSRPFQVMAVHEQARTYSAVHGLTVEELRPEAPFTKSDLTVVMADQSDRLRCGFLFDPTLLSETDVARWLSRFFGLIDRLASHPGGLHSLTIAEARR